MRKSLTLTAAFLASSALVSSPAAAAEYIFDADGESATIFFDGFGGEPVTTIDGLSAMLELMLNSGVGTDTYTFGYTLTNTSTVGGEDGRVSGFAFDSNPDAIGGSATGTFTAMLFNGGNYPNGIGDVGNCLTNSNSCAGGGGGAAGAYVGAPAGGTFTLTFADPAASVTLSDFHVRYQGLTGLNGIGSATGSEVPPVPEPGTWAMMLLGFGALGFAMRRRRRDGSDERRVRFAI